MSSAIKNLPAEPEQPPSPPPKVPPRVPPKDDASGPASYKYAVRLGTEGGGAEAAEALESDFSDSDEGHGLLQGNVKRRPSWQWLRRSRSWILAIIVSFLLACLTIKLFRHRSNSGGDGGSRSGSPFRTAKAAPPPTARDFALNFPEQYPPLASDTSEECRAAWGKLENVPCHSGVWTRNWDAGKMQPLGPGLSRYLPLICREPCVTALERAKDEVGQHCWMANWNLEGYNGRFNTTALEESPAAVTRTLRERLSHNCRESPNGDAELGYCMTDLEQRWWIWDGINANHMANLGSFLRSTNEKKLEPKRKMSGVKGGGDWKQSYNYWREERRFGPKKGDTTCSFCTANWFLRMLEAWNDSTVDENGDLIDLPHYLARVYQAGRRCTTSYLTFQQMFDMQVSIYKDRGLLEDNWEESAGSNKILAPSEYPTLLDHPLPSVRASIKKLEGMGDGMTKLHKGYASLLENFYEEAQSLTCNSLITFDDLKMFLDRGDNISPLCDRNCQYSRQDVTALLSRVSVQRKDMYSRYTEKHGLYNLVPLIDSEDVINQACRTEESRYHSTQPCSVIFHKFGRLDWLRQRIIDPEDLALSVQGALETLPDVPANLTDIIATSDSELSVEARADLQKWTRPLRNGACSLCFWRKFVSKPWFADEKVRTHVPGIDDGLSVSEETLRSWFGAVKGLYESCAAQGVRFEQREYDAIVEKVPEEMKDGLGQEGVGWEKQKVDRAAKDPETGDDQKKVDEKGSEGMRPFTDDGDESSDGFRGDLRRVR